MSGPQRALLDDGRLHLNHGPIDLVIEAFGDTGEVARGYAQATDRFEDILGALVGELALLKTPVSGARSPRAEGPVARRMIEAVWPHRATFVTPMAAVAGAVADEVLAAMVAGRDLARAYVNDGGDIAIHLEPGENFETGIVFDIERPRVEATATVGHDMPIRGIATSGRGGRSFSLGIADAVTVLARTGAEADVAATLIANAVNLDHPAIARRPARELDADSDLGDLLVTVGVGKLEEGAIEEALDAGAARAETMLAKALIESAVLAIRGRHRVVGDRPRRIQGVWTGADMGNVLKAARGRVSRSSRIGSTIQQ